MDTETREMLVGLLAGYSDGALENNFAHSTD